MSALDMVTDAAITPIWVPMPMGALNNEAFRPSLLSLCPTPLAQTVRFTGLWLLSSLVGNPMLEVEPTGRRSHTATRSGRHGLGNIVLRRLVKLTIYDSKMILRQLTE